MIITMMIIKKEKQRENEIRMGISSNMMIRRRYERRRREREKVRDSAPSGRDKIRELEWSAVVGGGGEALKGGETHQPSTNCR